MFDFADKSRKLLIEVDGGVHDLPEVIARDRIKDAWAKGQGFVVLRIPNSYVFGTGEPAVAMVMQAARSKPDPREVWRARRPRCARKRRRATADAAVNDTQ